MPISRAYLVLFLFSFSSFSQNTAGIRRSSYSKTARNQDDLWWAQNALNFAKSLSHLDVNRACIIQIVSRYKKTWTNSILEFSNPTDEKVAGAVFESSPPIDHERALSLYDRMGVCAIIQFEPGDADVSQLIRIAHKKFGHHPSVIGYGVDAEWHRTQHSKVGDEGVPITNDQAREWTDTVLAMNPNYTFFLKHYATRYMPPTYRHTSLWFLSDSQRFKNLEECLEDFTDWKNTYSTETVGYQIGYPDDRKWWSHFQNPTLDFVTAIDKRIPAARFYFWVDFTAETVKF